MATQKLTLAGKVDKYGVIVVNNKDGSFNREFRITGDELAALQQGKAFPSGLTQEEWESYRVVGVGRNPDGSPFEKREPLVIALGKAVDVGDIHEEPDGSLFVKFDEQVVNGRIVESCVRLKPGDWFGLLPNITVAPAKLDEAKAAPGQRVFGTAPAAISNGEVSF